MISLSPQAIPPNKIPPYPTYQLIEAKGGETTYDLDMGRIERASPRDAAPGELLRSPDLKYTLNWEENLRYRALVIANAKDNPTYIAMQTELCRSSVLYFINTYVWTYDPRRQYHRRIPFVTFPIQDQAVEWVLDHIAGDKSGLLEKSRDVGASWIAAAIAVWLVLFHGEMVPYFMSMTENEVDKGPNNADVGALLSKCRYVLENIPVWMRGGWTRGGQGCDVKMTITIPETRSIINGILSRGTAGRSGRATVVFADEFAFVEDSESVLKALGDLANCKLYLSTANGMGNAFYRIQADPSTSKLRMHWRDHPLKNEDWAKRRIADPEVTEEAWASEQEIDYTGSTPGRVYPKFISTPIIDVPWTHAQTGGYFEHDPHYDTYTGQDYGQADETFIAYAQIKPPMPEYHMFTDFMVVFFDEDEGTGTTVDEWRFILNQKGYRYHEHVGDQRTGHQSDSLGSNWIKNFRRPITGPVFSMKFKSQINPGPPIIVAGRYNSEFGPIQVVQRLLQTPGALAINSERCPKTLAAFQNWSYPTQENPITGLSEAVPGSKPLHNQYSHPMKAVAYLLDWKFGKEQTYGTGARDADFDYPAAKLKMR